MPIVHELAYAKLNLYLHITGKRADGYHLLDSLAAFVHAHDIIEAQPADAFSLQVGGPFGKQLAADENNLVLRAAKLLAQHVGIRRGAQLTLHKNLPVGAGLGGGSADAAATLRALNALWGLDIPMHQLQSLGSILGADVAACLHSRTVHMGGVGDIIAPAPALPRIYVLLVNPGVPLLTADVYKHFGGNFSPPSTLPAVFGTVQECMEFLRNARNDLEPPAIQLMPQIADIKKYIAAQPHCLLARMSGSGATCFGLFATLKAAQNAAQNLRLSHADWWVWAGVFQ